MRKLPEGEINWEFTTTKRISIQILSSKGDLTLKVNSWIWEATMLFGMGLLLEQNPLPPSSPSRGWNESFWTQSVPGEKGVVIPSSGECPEPFSETAFIGIGMCRGVQHTCMAYQSMSKGYSCRKQILSTDNNWRNTEVCLRSGCVRHADARWLLRRASWDKEFTLNIQWC